MHIPTLKDRAKSEVDNLMTPIVNYFEENKSLPKEELFSKWEDYKQEFHTNKYEIVCEILIENGVKDLGKRGADVKIKSIVTQLFPGFFDENVNDYYITKIKPFIQKSNQ